MDNYEPRQPSYYRKAVQLERITKFRLGNKRPIAKTPARFFEDKILNSTARRENTTVITNSRETTLESQRTQDFDEYSKKFIEKEADAILEGDVDFQSSLPYVSSTAKKIASRRKPQDNNNKQNHTTGIVGYLSYLKECSASDPELHLFRRKLKKKQRPTESAVPSLSLQNNESSLIGGKLRDAIMRKHEEAQEQPTPLLIKEPSDKRDFFRVSRIAAISTTFKHNMLNSRKNSASGRVERFREDRLKDQLKTLSKEYELFFNHSSKQKATYEKIMDYILDKPELVKIFINSKIKRFSEPMSSMEIYRELMPELESASRSPIRSSKRESVFSLHPNRKKSNAGSHFVRISKRIADQIKFFTLELQEVNMQFQLKEIQNLGERLANKESAIKIKFNHLAKKLYTINRKHYNQFCEVIDTIEKDRPTCRIRLDDKLVEFEKQDGDLPLINRRTREIGKAWDNLLIKWTNTRDRLVVPDSVKNLKEKVTDKN